MTASTEMEQVTTSVDAFDTQLINSDTTTNGNSIDMAFFESILFVIQAGVVTTGDAIPLVEDSPDDSVFTPVVDDFLVRKGVTSGQEADAKLDATNEVRSIAYVGKEQFVRLALVTDNSADLTIGAVAVEGNKRHVNPIT